MYFGGYQILLFLALLKEPLKDEEKQTFITHTPMCVSTAVRKLWLVGE
jgi:hypothetical protein